ncbi:MAG: cytochrome b/b6 domain-containing protein [Candidatus Methanoperedens sp.]|nr:cytochrome b/b6 domain-containing protein [Candidatus Methanoperedens sp.]MCZ7370797.1 cytochrome b/b6 domain-containing protein [Candidatus Methanoperedens sp.]
MSRLKLMEVSVPNDLAGDSTMGEVFFKRFTFNQLVQHWVMIGTFMLLVVTGMAVKFPDSWWSPMIIGLVGGFEMRTQIHHAAGIGMVLLGIYHVTYHIFVDKESLLERKVWPTVKDATDFWQTILFYIGKAEPPKYGRYSWKEKFDYWGAFWGMVMLCVTGLIMMFPFVAMKYIPYAYVQLSTIVHSDEALLATLFIFIVHWWNVHYSPEVFPMSKAWITGNLSEEQMKHEHPLEYEEAMRQMNQRNEKIS